MQFHETTSAPATRAPGRPTEHPPFAGLQGVRAAIARALAGARPGSLSSGALCAAVYGRETDAYRRRLSAMINDTRVGLRALNSPASIVTLGHGIGLSYRWTETPEEAAALAPKPVAAKMKPGITLPSCGLASWRYMPRSSSNGEPIPAEHIVRWPGEDFDRVHKVGQPGDTRDAVRVIEAADEDDGGGE